MSLKAVHLAFIGASAALSGVFSFWCFREYSRTGSLGSGIAAAAAAAALVALSVYAIRFAKKSQGLSYL